MTNPPAPAKPPERKPMNGSVWKWIAGLLAAVLITMAGTVVSLGRGAVDRREVEAIVERASPYVADRQWLRSEIERLSKGQERILEKLDVLANRRP